MPESHVVPLLPAVAVPFIGGVGWLAMNREPKPAAARVVELSTTATAAAARSRRG